jgi:PWI domain
MEKLEEHAPPQQLLEEMREILDDEAEAFVLKLYRVVIFETQKKRD